MTEWKCGERQGTLLTDAELCYVVDKKLHYDHDKQLIWVALALAESGGWTGNVSDCELGFSLGLWQINAKAHPITVKSVRDPFNAYTNAEMAQVVYQQGRGFKEWSAYNNGSYEQYLERARIAWPNKTKPAVDKPRNKDPLVAGAGDAVDKVTGAVTGVFDAATETAKALKSIVQAIAKAGGWLANPHNWLRILYVGLGAGVVAVGLAKLIGYDAGLSPTAAMMKLGKTGAKPAAKEPVAEEGSASE